MSAITSAQVRSQGLVLVTNNVSEFARIPGLMVANWVEPLQNQGLACSASANHEASCMGADHGGMGMGFVMVKTSKDLTSCNWSSYVLGEML
jgi:hypothetical protein